MKVALIRPPEVNPYWAAKRPSLGVSYLASYLKKNNIECKIFDANYWSWSEEEVKHKICRFRPDLIGISAMTHEIKAANRLAGLIKSELKETFVVIGGCHVTALPKQTLEEFFNFDFGIYGEGEKPLLQLVELLNKPLAHKKIKSLVYRDKNGRVIVNSLAERLTSQELKDLPYPDFDQYFLKSKRNLEYPIMASRGCPFDCAFCMRVLGKMVRRRSPEKVVEEMEYAFKKYQVCTFVFCDEIFLFNDKNSLETLKLMEKHCFADKFRWCATTRANLITKELAIQAKQSGCFALDLGIESGSDKILKRINKQITVEQAEQAIRAIKEAGITSFAYFILGHPGETVQTIRKTIDLAVKLNPDSIAVGLMVPYPGTKIFEMAKKGQWGYQLLSNDWAKYDKYGGSALSSNKLSLKELEKWQRRMFLEFYLKNGRVLDLVKFIFQYQKQILKLLARQLKIRKR